MQKKILQTKTLNKNLNNLFIVNNFYLNKIYKDKKKNINYNFLNNISALIIGKNKNKFKKDFYNKQIVKVNFLKKLTFTSYFKKKNKFKKNNFFFYNLYNIINYKKKMKNNKKKNFNKHKLKFNRLLFIKKYKIRKYSFFFNLLKKKLLILLKNKNNISYNKFKIIIYKLVNLLLHIKKKKIYKNRSRLFIRNLYFKSKKQKKLSSLFYKKSHKNNHKNVDYSFIKYFNLLFLNTINKALINIGMNKKQIISFIFYSFKFFIFNYSTKNKKLITKNNLFLNFRKIKKLRRRVGNNFFYKKKLYAERLENKYYSSLTKYRSNKKKKIKKSKFLFKKKSTYNIFKNRNIYKNYLYNNMKKKKIKTNFFLKNMKIKECIAFNSNKKNIATTNFLNYFYLLKKLLVVNYILKNINKYKLSKFNLIYNYSKYIFLNYNKNIYKNLKIKKIYNKDFNKFFYYIYISNLMDLYKKDILFDSYSMIKIINLYDKKLKKLLNKNMKKKNKIKNVIYAYLNIIEYIINNNINNNKITKNINMFKKKIKKKYIKKKIKKNRQLFHRRRKKINFNKSNFDISYLKFKKHLYPNNDTVKIKYKYKIKSNLNYNLNYFKNYLNLNNFYSNNKPLNIYYNITTKNTRYLISNSKFKILKSNSLGLLKISRREMRQKKSKLKLAEYFLKHFKIIMKKNKRKKIFNELRFHLIRHKYFTYLVFKLFKKYIRKKIKKIEKKKKKYFAKSFINMIYFLRKNKSYRKKKYYKNFYNSNRSLLINFLVKKNKNK